MQLLDLDPQLGAQLGVEIGQRLVEQKHVGLAHDRAADRDALTLAAGELRGMALEQRVELQHLRGRVDAPRDLGLRRAGDPQPERQVAPTLMRG